MYVAGFVQAFFISLRFVAAIVKCGVSESVMSKTQVSKAEMCVQMNQQRHNSFETNSLLFMWKVVKQLLIALCWIHALDTGHA